MKKNIASPKEIFQFKQFEVDQSGCAMKINTDGVLLAALADAAIPKEILDVGSGTGVIAMMLAQRFEKAQITAVEIDSSAAQTAHKNFINSIFSKRLAIINKPIHEFESAKQFDLIVSNPPFFVNDLKNTNEKKQLARHTDQLFFSQLIEKVSDLLHIDGTFWFILPVKQAVRLVADAQLKKLWPAKIIQLHSDESKPEFRRIVCLAKVQQEEPVIERFYIYKAEKIYTNAYVNLLKDFFLRLANDK